MTVICQITVQHNIVADALSRVKVITPPVRRDAISAAQGDGDELPTLLGSNTPLHLEKLIILGTSVELHFYR
jgi:hypothetical protein